MAAHLVCIDQKLQTLLCLRDDVDSLLSLPTKVDHLLELGTRVELFRETVKEVQTSIEFISDRCDSLLAIATSNERVIKQLQAESNSLRATVADQSCMIQRLQHEINESEQYGRHPWSTFQHHCDI